MPLDADAVVFDVAVLREVADAAGMAPAELLELFLSDAESNLLVIADAGARQDHVGLNRTAHSLKSSAASVGAMQMAAAARALELATKAGFDDESLAACAVLTEAIENFAAAVARASDLGH